MGEDRPQEKIEKLTIDLDRIWEPAGVGLRRASVFAGLGLNASLDPNLKDFDLPGLLKISFVAQREAVQAEEFKREFGHWILSSAFREAVESLALSLDGSYQVLHLVQWGQTKRRPAIKKLNGFLRAGIEGKLKTLEDEFGLQSSAAAYLRPLNKARNCLSHRMGVVGTDDCTDDSALVLRYKRMQFVVTDAGTGAEQVIPVDVGGTFVVETGGQVGLQFKEDERRFALGTRLILEPIAIKYIFWTLGQCAVELKTALASKIEEFGTKIQYKEGVL